VLVMIIFAISTDKNWVAPEIRPPAASQRRSY
jgi:hypothetical protein